MIEKTDTPRVLETSAIVNDPKSILPFQNDIYVCLTVLEEQDNLKERGEKSVSGDARVCIRMLEDLVGECDAEEMEAGIDLPASKTSNRGNLFIGVDSDIGVAESLKHGIGSDADNRIINFTLQLQKKFNQKVSIVSRDSNMKLKARTIVVIAEVVAVAVAVDSQIADVELLYAGVKAFDCDLFNDAVQYNMHWYDEAAHIGLITEVTTDHVFTKLLPPKQEKIWGTSSKNPRKSITLTQLTDPHYDLNIIFGPASSSKTFLAVAAALHQVLDTKQYKKIVVERSRDFMDEDSGFLPEDLKEKTMPLLAGITDTLISMHSDDEDERNIFATIEHANIEFTSMGYFRDRSLDDAFLILDPRIQNLKKLLLAQNQKPVQMATISNSKTRLKTYGDIKNVQELLPLRAAECCKEDMYNGLDLPQIAEAA